MPITEQQKEELIDTYLKDKLIKEIDDEYYLNNNNYSNALNYICIEDR